MTDTPSREALEQVREIFQLNESWQSRMEAMAILIDAQRRKEAEREAEIAAAREKVAGLLRKSGPIRASSTGAHILAILDELVAPKGPTLLERVWQEVFPGTWEDGDPAEIERVLAAIERHAPDIAAKLREVPHG